MLREVSVVQSSGRVRHLSIEVCSCDHYPTGQKGDLGVELAGLIQFANDDPTDFSFLTPRCAGVQ